MATLLTIAELLAGEALLSPGGPVDRITAASGDDVSLWQLDAATVIALEVAPETAEEALVTA